MISIALQEMHLNKVVITSVFFEWLASLVERFSAFVVATLVFVLPGLSALLAE